MKIEPFKAVEDSKHIRTYNTAKFESKRHALSDPYEATAAAALEERLVMSKVVYSDNNLVPGKDEKVIARAALCVVERPCTKYETVWNA